MGVTRLSCPAVPKVGVVLSAHPTLFAAFLALLICWRSARMTGTSLRTQTGSEAWG
jgi:hypothetical protein